MAGPGSITVEGSAARFTAARKESSLARAAWPLYLLLVLELALWHLDLPWAQESVPLLFGINLFFSALPSLLVCILIGRSFVIVRRPALLLLGCGALAWSSCGTIVLIVPLLSGVHNMNVLIAVHNVSCFLAALCTLSGAAIALRWSGATLRTPRIWLAVAYGLVPILLGLIALWALAGWMPVFYDYENGSSPMRRLVLASSIAMFCYSAVLLRSNPGIDRKQPYFMWYFLALLTQAVALLGYHLSAGPASAVAWVARLAQAMGGVYLLLAVREVVRLAGLRAFVPMPLQLILPSLARSRLRRAQIYGVAVFIVLVTVIVRLLLAPTMEHDVVLTLFIPAVLLAALYGGFWPGMLATALAIAMVNHDWIGPTWSDWVSYPLEYPRVLFFILSGMLISAVAERMQRAMDHAHEADAALHGYQRQLETLVQQRTLQLQNEIGQRKLAENTLHKAQRIANIGSWEWDVVSGEVHWSEQTRRILGMTRVTVTPSLDGLVAMIHPDDRPPFEKALKETLAHAGSGSVEVRVVDRKGGVRHIRIDAEVQWTVGMQVKGMIGTLMDISAIKETELALQAAKAESERANNAKSRFLAAASHDLRQPLAALNIYVDVLKTKVEPEDRPVLSNMGDCVESLSELLTDLLDISKLDAGVVTPQLTDFAVNDLLIQINAVHAPEAVLKNLRLHCVATNLYAHVDPVLYRRMLSNLVSNAIRYTESGGIVVGCRRHQGRLWMEVWDSGIGIPADKTAEIFEEFKQLDNDARQRGSGLGLAIVAKSAALLGLKMRVRSWPGCGSMFAIELPRGREVLAAPKREISYRRLQIALAEDNINVREALVCALENSGHDVISGASGAELLQELEGLNPDIILSDYRLSEGETGFAVITAVRSMMESEVPAIMLTGDTDPKLMRGMAGRGIVVLHKPVDMTALQECIAELTQQASMMAIRTQ